MLRRTVWCGEVRGSDEGREVGVCGWVDGVRDHGGVLFVDLRDRTGLVQVVIDPQRSGPLAEAAKEWRAEWSVGVRGMVRRRAPGNENPRLATGDVEVEPAEAEVFSRSRPLPFPLEAADVDEVTRLRYRYLDLRRPALQANLVLRHRLTKAVRDYLDARGFLEIETPTLTRSTPEGARDYLVPARTAPGHFYALPQSPQLFKQLLMVGGLERYFQIARCWRDEDLRADRQPEFTQVDLEMSYVSDEDVMALTEGMLRHAAAAVGVALPGPFPRLTYADAMLRYGSDKPDLRADLAIRDLGVAFRGTGFRGFTGALAAGGTVRALTVPGAGALSRRELDELTAQAKEWGAGGLAWFLCGGEGEARVGELAVRSPIAKFLSPEELAAVLGASGAGAPGEGAGAAGPAGTTAAASGTAGAEAVRAGVGGAARAGDAVFVLAGAADLAATVLGRLRLWAMDRYQLRDAATPWRPLWVTDFPLFAWNAEERRWDSMHHAFTAPWDEDVPLISSEPGRVRGKHYDAVLNGTELGSGSIRIHRAEVQSAVFDALRIGREEAQERFGFLLEAFAFGPPPHGGIALGLDRLAMLFAGTDSIRDVVAFPKTARGADPMTGAPAAVAAKQLRELHLRTEVPAGGRAAGGGDARA